MKKTYVRLNRTLGATDLRVDDEGYYEMLIPIKTNTGFEVPKRAYDMVCFHAFKKYLLQGKTILVNNAGGWNYLSKTDHIIDIYQK